MFSERMKIIREASINAHLCPFLFRGVRSWLVKFLINQLWRVIRRLFCQRLDGDGTKIHGRVSAMAISGMPRYVVLINWSNMFSAMVSFKCLFLNFQY